jgi:hypothetical protein
MYKVRKRKGIKDIRGGILMLYAPSCEFTRGPVCAVRFMRVDGTDICLSEVPKRLAEIIVHHRNIGGVMLSDECGPRLGWV